MAEPETPTITELSVAGFKSIRDEIRLPILPLTVLAGVNSSGKTSLLQPLLLLKQTLEAPFDPGPLLLNGPHVAFLRIRELIPSCWRDREESLMRFGVRAQAAPRTRPTAAGQVTPAFKLGTRVAQGTQGIELVRDEGLDALLASSWPEQFGRREDWVIERRRFSWEALSQRDDQPAKNVKATNRHWWAMDAISWCVHLPGLRGSPERSYPLTSAGPKFSGPFPPYTASVLTGWQRAKASELEEVRRELSALKLTSTVEAVYLNDTQVALQVGRFAGGRPAAEGEELVDISDVGVGVSQVLPVIVALYAAAPGALVYIEQPELHLHPRAQVALAGVLARAIKRGIKLVIETHSSLLLTGIQTEIAEGRLSPSEVNLSWVERDEEGWTRVRRAELQDDGTFGDWPVDFDEVQLEAGRRFLDAVDRKHGGS